MHEVSWGGTNSGSEIEVGWANSTLCTVHLACVECPRSLRWAVSEPAASIISFTVSPKEIPIHLHKIFEMQNLNQYGLELDSSECLQSIREQHLNSNDSGRRDPQ